MTLFNKLKKVISSNSKTKSTTTKKSLKAILEAVDFHVFRYREKTGVTITGARGWKHEQRQLQDCTVVRLPGSYKLFALNIEQFLAKENDEYPETINWQIANKRTNDNFTIKSLPKEVQADIGLKIVKWKYTAKKEGYIAWLDKKNVITTLRKKEFEWISTKGTSSQKSIYREKRNGNLEDSFIKQVWLVILSVVKDKNWKQLIDADIEPHNYQPKSENSENKSKNIEIVQEEKDLDLSI